MMKTTAFAIVLALSALVSGIAHAQLYPPGGVGAQPVIPFPGRATGTSAATDRGADGAADEFAAAVRIAEHDARRRDPGHAAEAGTEARPPSIVQRPRCALP